MGFDMVSGESIVKEGSANYEKGWEAVGGKLTLTTHRLFFQSHSLNCQKGGLGLDLREIVGVRPCFSKLFGLLPIIPGAVGVRTKRGQEYRFVVLFTERAKWIDAIKAGSRSKR